MLTIRFECRQVGSGELTFASEISEGVLSAADRSSLLAVGADLATTLRGPNQHSGSLVARLSVAEDGREIAGAGAIGVLTEPEVLDLEGRALQALTARHAAQKAKAHK